MSKGNRSAKLRAVITDHELRGYLQIVVDSGIVVAGSEGFVFVGTDGETHAFSERASRILSEMADDAAPTTVRSAEM
jgi:hypothetical protein